VHIDSEVQNNPILPLQKISDAVRTAVLSHHHLIFLPVLALGLAAFVLTTVLGWEASNV
jgi:hypothetical protein